MVERFREIYKYREMIKSLVKRELRGRYKGSFLGFLWTFINPLLQLLVYTMVFSVFLRSNIEQFYLYLFVGLIPWVFFASSIAAGSSSIINQKNLVQKIYFPREIIPIAHVTTCFVNMLLTFVIIFPVVIIAGVKLNPIGVLVLPVIMFVEYLLALGFTLIVSSSTVYLRDLEHILGIIMMTWMYLTPILYQIEIIPKQFQFLFIINPMTSIIIAYRDVLYYGEIPELMTLANATVFGVALVVVGFWVFDKLKKSFAEEL